jgi:hypothetical protein
MDDFGQSAFGVDEPASVLPEIVRRGSDGSVVSGGIGMSGSHTAGKSMLVQGPLIQSDFRTREEGKLAAVAFWFPSSSRGDARPGELPVVCRRPPVMLGAQIVDHRARATARSTRLLQPCGIAIVSRLRALAPG